MTIMIPKKAATEDIIHVAEATILVSLAKGSPWKEDAEQYLAVPATVIRNLRDRRATTSRSLARLRAQQKVYDEKCDALVNRTRDMLYNLVGRPAADPVFDQIFPGGAGTYTSERPVNKPAALALLAGVLENSLHPRIPAAVVATVAAELRTTAAALLEVNLHLGPAKTEGRILQAQWTIAGRNLQLWMARLKKYWRSQGMSEAEVHQIIPGLPGGKKESASAAAAAAPVEATPVPLTLVPSSQDGAEDDGAEEGVEEEGAAEEGAVEEAQETISAQTAAETAEVAEEAALEEVAAK